MASSVIFLDIDGVVLPFGTYKHLDSTKVLRDPDDYLDELVRITPIELVHNIQLLTKDLDAKIVLISTWRYLFPQEWLKKYLELIGLGPLLHADWIAMDGDRTRWMHFNSKNTDMVAWLYNHEWTGDAHIIDDENEPPSFPHITWIKPDPMRGFEYNVHSFDQGGDE